jgi:hypothetical protein
MLTAKYCYDQYTIGIHDVIRLANGERCFRGLNVCMNKQGRTWQRPYRSEQAASIAISHELLRAWKDRQSVGKFNWFA